MTFDIRYDTKDIYIGRPKEFSKPKQKPVQKYSREQEINKIDENDKSLTHHNVKKSDSDYIKRRRNELKLTQKDLAIKCNLNVKVIQDYENGTAIINQKILANIKRHLQ